ncbi:alpha-ketoglutarate-dependent dioxygenase AlkB [Tamlana fucoidanivorans]|uniref:Alpha-ketoglutarate-dependent dioxygenase AlkB n=1 Tax=Allotamlana fucoidanivorans TaxID=2583814 RepID=A0A5C4SKI0_9FLAO|nr:alpha-ketoglutarate-dependent dioxygenase AlkB [Tamlana fucoidanivorans]TNJ43541.1 alpha-ketoglutarate-dependent dioxygenase AlkB [Tamlana fucoidanivorans]
MLLKSPTNLNLKDANVSYYPKFLNQREADAYFLSLLKNIKWQHDVIKFFGKTYEQPRLTSFFANNGKAYCYSNITMQPHRFTKDLLKIKSRIESQFNVIFTSCLANLYRNGSDSNGWHADNEKELGLNPIIASISLGTARVFQLKHKKNNLLKSKIVLEHGSLLLMQGETQSNWLHQIPKTRKIIGKRINLTFRYIA